MKNRSGYVVIVAILIHFILIKRIFSFRYSNGIYEFIGWLFVYGIVWGISKLVSKKLDS